MVRCKFRCAEKVLNMNGHVIKLEPVTCGSPENQKFFKYTPYGKLEVGTINEEAAKQFQVGKEYFIDINLAE